MNWSRNIMLGIVSFITFLMVSLWSMFLLGCDFQENALVREQTETFTGEIKDKNKDIQILANKLEIAEEQIRQLKHQLLCREELIDEEVNQAKRDALKNIPIIPNKSNKAEKERENKG